MTSDKQLVANRRNAQKSTGPKTDQGKAATKYNALRHGLLAQGAIIPGEDASVFYELYEDLRKEFSPDGELEFRLVDLIATSFWRLRRLGRVEAGIFAMQRFKIDVVRASNEAEKFVETSSIIDFPDFTETKITNEISYQKAMSQAEKARQSQQEDLPTMGLAFVEDARSENAFSKLSRYEAGIERSLYRAIHELQRLQAGRRDAKVPAPVVIDVTGDPGSSG